MEKVVQKNRSSKHNGEGPYGNSVKEKRFLSAAQPANGADASVLRTSAPLIGALDLMKKRLLFAIFALTSLFGACDVWLAGMPESAKVTYLWVTIASVSALMFWWVHLDAIERKYAKSKWLNIGILGLSIVFVPVYLCRSRSKGDKLKVLGGFILALMGYTVFGYAGSLLAEQFPL